APVPEHDRQGERHGRDLLPHAGASLAVSAAHAAPAAGGARGERAGRGEAGVLRRPPRRLPLPAAGLLALVREPAAARDRPRHGRQAAASAPRRARGRDEPRGDPRDDRADRAAALGGRLHDPRHRARHARRRGDLRPRRRTRPRRQDRRGLVRVGGDEREGGRGLPRSPRRPRGRGVSGVANIAVARSSYEAFGRGDLDGALEMMDEAIEWHQAQGLPHGGVYRGLANVRAAIFDPLDEDWWEDFDATPTEFLAGGDHVVVLRRYIVRRKRTGTPLDVPYAHV